MQSFSCTTKIYSGRGSLAVLESCKAERVLVVSDPFFSRNGKAMEIGKLIPNAQVKLYDQVTSDPSVELIAKGAAICADYRPELLIALGGGSTMDCAKGIRLICEHPMEFVAIPTTAGSGSEVTSFSVLTSEGRKYPVVDDLALPDLAILDASLLDTMPEGLAIDTAMDVLAHCIEAVAAANSSRFTDALAIYGAKTAFAQLAAAENRKHPDRTAMLEAASMAGIAFNHAGLGLCHAVAHALGGSSHVPHGRLCAMVLPHVIELNEQAAQKAYWELACSCGFGASTHKMSVRNLIRAIVQLRTALGIPSALYRSHTDLPKTSELIDAVLQDSCCRTNPVSVLPADVEKILKAVVC